MKLPQKLPGSFNFSKKSLNKDGSVHPDNLKISYKFEVFIEGMRFDFCAEKEIIVK